MRFLIFVLIMIFVPQSVAEDVTWIDKDIIQIMDNERTIWYTDKEILPVFQDNERLVNVGYNNAGTLDRTGSANNEAPWFKTSGIENIKDKSFAIRRFLYLPENGKIKLKNNTDRIKQRGNVLKEWISGEFPNNTVSGQVLYTDKGIFAVRILKKEIEWHGFERNNEKLIPEGYKKPNNCVDCHSDIGKDSFEINPRRQWYGTVRGLEPGGPIHFHVFDDTLNRIQTRKFNRVKIADKWKSILDLSNLK